MNEKQITFQKKERLEKDITVQFGWSRPSKAGEKKQISLLRPACTVRSMTLDTMN